MTNYDPYAFPATNNTGLQNNQGKNNTSYDPYAFPQYTAGTSGSRLNSNVFNTNQSRRSTSSPHRYRIIDEHQGRSISPNQTNLRASHSQPHISIVDPQSLVQHIERSQVRPVDTQNQSDLGINRNLIPYPPENPLYPENILNMPGGNLQHSRVVDKDGNIIEITKKSGNFLNPTDQGGSYESTYLYKSEVKEQGQG